MEKCFRMDMGLVRSRFKPPNPRRTPKCATRSVKMENSHHFFLHHFTVFQYFSMKCDILIKNIVFYKVKQTRSHLMKYEGFYEGFNLNNKMEKLRFGSPLSVFFSILGHLDLNEIIFFLILFFISFE